MGKNYSTKLFEYENAEGKLIKLDLSDYLDALINDTISRLFMPHNLMFPLFVASCYSPTDWRYARNIDRFRAILQTMIDDRRSGKTNSYGDSDLLSILTVSEFFVGNDDLIKDEIVTFFFAGMKTIQVSTCNLIYYLTKHPEYKAKLLKEILPAVEKVKDNVVEGLEYETVMDFEYLNMCYNESLRMEPPAANSVMQTTT